MLEKKYESEEELPKIHQTLFIVDKDRKYLFDVNENILIKKLKGMIVAAADLNRVGLRIFHEGIEYTNEDEKALNELFPGLELVEFDIRYSYEQVEDLDEIINLKIKQHCFQHNDKYPYFYCFTCKKSICSSCLAGGEHINHDTKEKYDYLQESKNLVEILFKDLKDLFKNTKEGSDDAVEALKAKVSIQFFPKLVEMVKQIEQKMMNLITFFLEKEKGNYNTIENNVKSLKTHCEEGLNKLKKEIVIEDLMINEDVFLTFDSKFKEIGEEKEKFKQDIEKYKQFSDNLAKIQAEIEKTYKEIYDFLLKYLTVTEYKEIKKKIDAQNIEKLDGDDIINKLLSDVKKRGSEIKSPYQSGNKNNYVNNNNFNNNNNVNNDIGNQYYLRSRNVPTMKPKEFMVEEKDDIKRNILKKKDMNLFGDRTKKGEENMDVENKDEEENINDVNNDNDNNKNIKVEKYIETDKVEDKDNNKQNYNINNNIESGYNFSGNLYNNDNNINNSIEPLKKNEIIVEAEEEEINDKNNDLKNNNNYNMHIMDLRSGNKKISLAYNNNINNTKSSKDDIELNNKNKSQLQEKPVEVEEEEEEEMFEGEIYNIVCNVIPSKNQVILYNVDKDSITKKEITFSPLLGISHFLQECAWVNNNNKLYILGGVDDFTKSSNIFLEYDPIKEKIRRLPDSKFTHSRHSLFAYNEQIFVVGGDKLECEKYDINKNEWTVLPNLGFKQIYPVLYVHNDNLYSFFGIDENIKKTDNIQKLNLRNNRAKWQKVNYKRNKCNLCVFGCGIAKINENCVLFLGGMDDNGIRDEAIQFDFSNLSAKKTEFLLEEKAYFKDSVLLRLSQKDFGNFSIEDSHPFLKIKFQVNVKKMN